MVEKVSTLDGIREALIAGAIVFALAMLFYKILW